MVWMQGDMVPRRRIELRTPAFSGLQQLNEINDLQKESTTGDSNEIK